jgi:hypothetical protein
MAHSYRLARERALPAGRERARRLTTDEADLGRSVERVVDRARDVLQDQVQLWRLEAIEAAQHASRGVAGLVAGAAFGAGAWVVLMMALYELLLAWIAPEASLLLVALLNAAIGLAALLIGRRELQRTRSGRGDGRS